MTDKLEIRECPKGQFDELIARRPDHVHVETMDDKRVWMAFRWDDGTEHHLWIESNGKLRYSLSDETKGRAG